MKHILVGASVLALMSASAQAGGIERAGNDYGVMFEQGDTIRLSFSSVQPKISGDYSAQTNAAAAGTGVGIGVSGTDNMSGSYTSLGFGYKNDLSDKLSFGLFVNQPYGADADYTQGFYTGLTAQWNSQQIATILKYRVADRVSVYGGFRYVRSENEITIPDQMIRANVAAGAQAAQAAATALATAGVPNTDPSFIAASTQAATLGGIAAAPVSLQYDAQGDRTGDWGYVLGAAYEIPDIALRVALTWESAITHKFDTSEVLPGFGLNSTGGTTEIEMPQTVTLDFQSGVAPGTLVFGSIKWAEWSQWEVRPSGYDGLFNANVTDFENDTVTWKLGVGRQFTEEFSGIAQISYEKSNGGTSSRLSPVDGRTSLALAGQYTKDNMKIRGGVEYVRLGDAEDASGVKFEGNSALGLGLSVTFGF